MFLYFFFVNTILSDNLVILMGMREKAIALFVFICAVMQPHSASLADYVGADVYGGELHLIRDTFLAPGVTVQSDGVHVDASIKMQNMATVFGDIYVCDDCDFHIQNSGEVYGRIHLGNGSEITQVVRSAADITFLEADAPYVVLADGVRDARWGDLFVLGMGAGTLVLRDSDVVFSDSAMPYAAGAASQIVLDGVVTLRLSKQYAMQDGMALMHNVSGGADIVVDAPSPGELYAYAAKVENNDLYITTVRETDYYKILGDRRGVFLNIVREERPDDALLRRLDTAASLSELHSIMLRSVVFNPGILGRPIRIMDRFMTDGVAVNDMASSAWTVAGRPFYIADSDYDIYGLSIDIGAPSRSGFSFGASLYGAMAESDDEINAFSARMLGGKIHAVYDADRMWVRGVVGATYGDFDVPYVFDAGRIRDNVHAVSVYGVADIGFVLGIFTPYVGAEYHGTHILDARRDRTSIRAGVDAVLSWRGETGTYKFKMGGGLNSRQDTRGGFAVGFYSPDDMIGGDVAVDIIHADNGCAGMFSFSVKIEF